MYLMLVHQLKETLSAYSLPMIVKFLVGGGVGAARASTGGYPWHGRHTTPHTGGGQSKGHGHDSHRDQVGLSAMQVTMP